MDGNRFKCPYCPSTFSHKFNVPRHIKSHHEGLQQTDVEIKEEKTDLKGLYIQLGPMKTTPLLNKYY